MKVILCENIEKLGLAGETKEVAAGYARNFLLPRDLAMVATPANLRKWESEKKVREIRFSKNLENAQSLAAQLEGVTVELVARSGREGHLFGSVTHTMIAEALEKQGFKVDKKSIVVEEPIKALGEYSFTVKLHSKVSAAVKLLVKTDNVAQETPA